MLLSSGVLPKKAIMAQPAGNAGERTGPSPVAATMFTELGSGHQHRKTAEAPARSCKEPPQSG